jgi:DNA polymerase III epsilon subunit-like protein
MRFACVDIETSGTSPQFHDVIEVGIVLLSKELELIREETFSLPFFGHNANPEALKVNGWGKRPFPPKVEFREGHAIIEAAFAEYKTTAFIGMHAHFDSAFLEAVFARYLSIYETPWRKHVYDLPSMACGRWGVLPPMRSQNMLKFLDLTEGKKEDVEGSDAHTALGDARTNAAVLRALKLGPAWGSS